MRGLAAELGRWKTAGSGRWNRSCESLELLGVAEEEWEDFLSATLLALRGWGGMVQQVEIRGDRAVHPVPAGSLVEFLAVRLMLDRFALAYTARDGPGIRRAAERRSGRRPGAGSTRTGRRASSSGPSWCSSSPRSLGLSPDVLHRLSKRGVGDAPRGDRGLLRARAAADLPPRLRAAVPHPDARRHRPARRRSRPDARRAAVPGGLLPRRARGIVPPPPGGARPRRRDLRRGGVLQRGDVLPRGGRRPLHPALPGRHPAPALGRRGGRRRAERGPAPPGADPPGPGHGVASVPRRQPDASPSGPC